LKQILLLYVFHTKTHVDYDILRCQFSLFIFVLQLTKLSIRKPGPRLPMGDNKDIGDHNLHQTSQSTEQGNGSTDNTHMEAHPSSQSSSSSQNSSLVPSDETNNTGNECIIMVP